MKRLLMVLVIMMLSVPCLAKDVWMKSGTVSGNIVQYQEDGSVVERDYVLTTDGKRTRIDVHFIRGEGEDYSMLTEGSRQVIRSSHHNSIAVMDQMGQGEHSILRVGLDDGYEVEMDNGFPVRVSNGSTVWTYYSWKPGKLNYHHLVLQPEHGDLVEYGAPGKTYVYQETGELDTGALLSKRLLGPVNCATGAVHAVSALFHTEDVGNLSYMVNDAGYTRMSNVTSKLRAVNLNVMATKFDLDALTYDDVVMVHLEGRGHMVVLARVTQDGGYLIDLASKRFLSYVCREKLEAIFGLSSTMYIVSDEAIVGHVERRVRDVMIATPEYQSCTRRIQWWWLHSCDYEFHIDCEVDADWCIIYERFGCEASQVMEFCNDDDYLIQIQSGDCYIHATLGCISDWSTVFNIWTLACK